MPLWPRHLYIQEGLRLGLGRKELERHLDDAHLVQGRGLPAVLSLRHLSVMTHVPYEFLRGVVSRHDEIMAYRRFFIAKRGGGYRKICVPHPLLHQAQRWIATHILNALPVHEASVAYCPRSHVKEAASRHVGARWLVKLDITSFFESISEAQVYEVFHGVGYAPLLAFELARICTDVVTSDHLAKARWSNRRPERGIGAYVANGLVGFLPQGASTSPMLSNLVARRLDERIARVAAEGGWRFTRYSDDIALSKVRSTRDEAVKMLHCVRGLLMTSGFRPNKRKTSVAPPGARKVVLGLLIDRERVRLTRDFRKRLEAHLYGIVQFGPQAHADFRGFSSVLGLRRHIEGLIAHTAFIDASYAASVKKRMANIVWPI